MFLSCDGIETLEQLKTVYLDKGRTPIGLASCRELKNDVAVIRLEGADSPEAAQKYLGKTLYMNREDVKLPEDVWFIDDLIGLSVVDADSGKTYGTIDEIFSNGSADVYSLRTPEGKQYLFPAVSEVLIRTDIDGGRLYIRPLPNLFEIYEGTETADEN